VAIVVGLTFAHFITMINVSDSDTLPIFAVHEVSELIMLIFNKYFIGWRVKKWDNVVQFYYKCIWFNFRYASI